MRRQQTRKIENIALFSVSLGVSLATQNRVENPQPRFAVEVAHRMVQVDVHVVEGLLPVLHFLATGLAQVCHGGASDCAGRRYHRCDETNR